MLRPNTRIALVFFIFLSNQILAQQNHSDREYRKYPHWITMMEDSLTNYFEIQKAFDTYWSDKEIPKEEDEILGMKGVSETEKENKEGWLRKLFKKRRGPDEVEMAYALKKYRHWLFLTAPWVQDDGRILFPAERSKLLQDISR